MWAQFTEQDLLQQGYDAHSVHPLSVLLVEVVGWWCSNMVCGCTQGTQVLGLPGRCMPRSVTACVLSRITQHKLQSDVQMAATCAGSEVPKQG